MKFRCEPGAHRGPSSLAPWALPPWPLAPACLAPALVASASRAAVPCGRGRGRGPACCLLPALVVGVRVSCARLRAGRACNQESSAIIGSAAVTA